MNTIIIDLQAIETAWWPGAGLMDKDFQITTEMICLQRRGTSLELTFDGQKFQAIC